MREKVRSNNKRTDSLVQCIYIAALTFNFTETFETSRTGVVQHASRIIESKRRLGSEFIFESLEGRRRGLLGGRGKGSSRSKEGGKDGSLHGWIVFGLEYGKWEILHQQRLVIRCVALASLRQEDFIGFQTATWNCIFYAMKTSGSWTNSFQESTWPDVGILSVFDSLSVNKSDLKSNGKSSFRHPRFTRCSMQSSIEDLWRVKPVPANTEIFMERVHSLLTEATITVNQSVSFSFSFSFSC